MITQSPVPSPQSPVPSHQSPVPSHRLYCHSSLIFLSKLCNSFNNIW
ncbi:MAG: hypothetical protein ACKPEO_10035 [Sphaerospermopsis kisseleviana]